MSQPNASLDAGVIRRLDEVVVNRIAAGEIIRRPGNALKEMIENSLDAKSTAIQITVKDGGLKLLQIQDNGTGIRKDDLEILCERFTTSKLQHFEDLSSMATFGFRGEALASISHVAHLSVQTKTVGSQCAFRAIYSDSKLIGALKAVAGNQGTQITVADLFYNAPQRKQALRSATDEFHFISDVVSKYAVHNAHVSFTLKKLGENNSVRTLVDSTVRQNIALIYGANIAKELLELNTIDTTLRFECQGFMTNVNYSSKKSTILLFINHRLVESVSLKTAIDETYAVYLPKGAHPFMYLSLQIDAQNVDVNVHPTKHEVHFLHEDEIIDTIKRHIEKTLLGSSTSRKYYAQTLLPGAEEPPESISGSDRNNAKTEKSVQPKEMVRTDSSSQKIEKFFGNATLLSGSLNQSRMENDLDGSAVDVTFAGDTISMKSSILPKFKTLGATKPKLQKKQTKLTSILRMRKQLEVNCAMELRAILNDSIFIGCVDRTRALIQYDTNMYLCNTCNLSEELFYQVLLNNFENFGHVRFSAPGLCLVDLAVLALKSTESGWTPDDGRVEDLAESVRDILVEKTAILREYYAFEITADGYLMQLPVLLDNHQPSLAHLPMYVLCLATEVDWDDECLFFETFSRQTASYYAHIPYAVAATQSSNGDDGDDAWKWYVEHVVYPACKLYMLPPRQFMSNNTFLVVASLPKLYKVFERC